MQTGVMLTCLPDAHLLTWMRFQPATPQAFWQTAAISLGSVAKSPKTQVWSSQTQAQRAGHRLHVLPRFVVAASLPWPNTVPAAPPSSPPIARRRPDRAAKLDVHRSNRPSMVRSFRNSRVVRDRNAAANCDDRSIGSPPSWLI
jgi:hypothetical protein